MINNIGDIGYIAWIVPFGFNAAIANEDTVWSTDSIYKTPEEIINFAKVEYSISNETEINPQDLVIWKVEILKPEDRRIPVKIKFLEPVAIMKA